MFDILLDSLIDALLDGAKLLPFLFVAFLILEGVEHHSQEKLQKLFEKKHLTGPVWGALVGLVPQCGFSVMASNMYAGGIISLGTLIAIYLSTSDEAVIIMLTGGTSLGDIIPLLLCKLAIGIFWGMLINFAVGIARKHDHVHHSHEPHDLCENCGCDKYPGIVRPALYHTVKLFIFILIFNFVINSVIGFIGEDRLADLLMGGTVFQPMITALIGLIPNCAASVLITELYLAGSISFGSAVAGLCAGAGVGLAVLFKMHSCTMKNVRIVILLYALSVVSGIVVNLFCR